MDKDNRRRNTMELGLGDCVKYLLVLLQKNGVPFSFRDSSGLSRWHLFFFKIKEAQTVSRKPLFFQDLFFDWDGPYPKCQDLAYFLHVLCVHGGVVTTSPSYEPWWVPENMAALWTRQLEELDPESKRFLDEALVLARDEFSRGQVIPTG